MPERAHVTSVDAIKAFKTSLIVYLSKARPTLEEISSDILRLRLWLQDDQQSHWEGEIRRRSRKLQDAQQALFSARISNLSDATAAEQVALTRAKRALDEADSKLRTVKRWTRDFDSRVEPMAKQLEKLQTILSEEMPRAIAYLTHAINTLDAYANVAQPVPDAAGAQAASPTPTKADKSVVKGETP
jgi:chromosome segregation ATPase